MPSTETRQCCAVLSVAFLVCVHFVAAVAITISCDINEVNVVSGQDFVVSDCTLPIGVPASTLTPLRTIRFLPYQTTVTDISVRMTAQVGVIMGVQLPPGGTLSNVTIVIEDIVIDPTAWMLEGADGAAWGKDEPPPLQAQNPLISIGGQQSTLENVSILFRNVVVLGKRGDANGKNAVVSLVSVFATVLRNFSITVENCRLDGVENSTLIEFAEGSPDSLTDVTIVLRNVTASVTRTLLSQGSATAVESQSCLVHLRNLQSAVNVGVYVYQSRLDCGQVVRMAPGQMYLKNGSECSYDSGPNTAITMVFQLWGRYSKQENISLAVSNSYLHVESTPVGVLGACSPGVAASVLRGDRNYASGDSSPWTWASVSGLTAVLVNSTLFARGRRRAEFIDVEMVNISNLHFLVSCVVASLVVDGDCHPTIPLKCCTLLWSWEVVFTSPVVQVMDVTATLRITSGTDLNSQFLVPIVKTFLYLVSTSLLSMSYIVRHARVEVRRCVVDAVAVNGTFGPRGKSEKAEDITRLFLLGVVNMDVVSFPSYGECVLENSTVVVDSVVATAASCFSLEQSLLTSTATISSLPFTMIDFGSTFGSFTSVVNVMLNVTESSITVRNTSLDIRSASAYGAPMAVLPPIARTNPYLVVCNASGLVILTDYQLVVKKLISGRAAALGTLGLLAGMSSSSLPASAANELRDCNVSIELSHITVTVASKGESHATSREASQPPVTSALLWLPTISTRSNFSIVGASIRMVLLEGGSSPRTTTSEGPTLRSPTTALLLSSPRLIRSTVIESQILFENCTVEGGLCARPEGDDGGITLNGPDALLVLANTRVATTLRGVDDLWCSPSSSAQRLIECFDHDSFFHNFTLEDGARLALRSLSIVTPSDGVMVPMLFDNRSDATGGELIIAGCSAWLQLSAAECTTLPTSLMYSTLFNAPAALRLLDQRTSPQLCSYWIATSAVESLSGPPLVALNSMNGAAVSLSVTTLLSGAAASVMFDIQALSSIALSSCAQSSKALRGTSVVARYALSPFVDLGWEAVVLGNGGVTALFFGLHYATGAFLIAVSKSATEEVVLDKVRFPGISYAVLMIFAPGISRASVTLLVSACWHQGAAPAVSLFNSPTNSVAASASNGIIGCIGLALLALAVVVVQRELGTLLPGIPPPWALLTSPQSTTPKPRLGSYFVRMSKRSYVKIGIRYEQTKERSRFADFRRWLGRQRQSIREHTTARLYPVGQWFPRSRFARYGALLGSVHDRSVRMGWYQLVPMLLIDIVASIPFRDVGGCQWGWVLMIAISAATLGFVWKVRPARCPVVDLTTAASQLLIIGVAVVCAIDGRSGGDAANVVVVLFSLLLSLTSLLKAVYSMFVRSVLECKLPDTAGETARQPTPGTLNSEKGTELSNFSRSSLFSNSLSSMRGCGTTSEQLSGVSRDLPRRSRTFSLMRVDQLLRTFRVNTYELPTERLKAILEIICQPNGNEFHGPGGRTPDVDI